MAQEINTYKVLIIKLKERSNLEDLAEDGNTISKWFASCEHRNEPSGSAKRWEILE
jgi:hypothetical protein